MPTRANRDTNSYGMKVGNGAQAPHTEIEDRICLNIRSEMTDLKFTYCFRAHMHETMKYFLFTENV